MEAQCLNEAQTIGLILLESIMINDSDSVKYLLRDNDISFECKLKCRLLKLFLSLQVQFQGLIEIYFYLGNDVWRRRGDNDKTKCALLIVFAQ